MVLVIFRPVYSGSRAVPSFCFKLSSKRKGIHSSRGYSPKPYTLAPRGTEKSLNPLVTARYGVLLRKLAGNHGHPLLGFSRGEARPAELACLDGTLRWRIV